MTVGRGTTLVGRDLAHEQDQRRAPRRERSRAARVEIVVPIRTLIAIAGFAALAALLIALQGALLSIVVAAVLSLGLDPLVGALVARGWPRGRAAVCVFASFLVAIALIVAVTLNPLWNEVRAFAGHLPGYWNQLVSNPTLKPMLSSVSERSVDSHLSTLAQEVPRAASMVLGLAGSAFSSLLSVVTLVFLSLFLLIERPRITDWLFGFARPQTEARWRPILDQSISVVAATLLGNVLISIVAGVVAGLSAFAFGLPYPVVLAVITGLLDLIPQLGATLAGLLLVLAALTVSIPTAIAMLAIQLIYQQVENNVLYPIVFRRTVSLSPLTTILAVMIGASLLGVVGAIVAVPLAALGKIAVNEVARPRRERMASLRSPSSGEVPADLQLFGHDADEHRGEVEE
ncbi:MAG TPA: AI-2E family transporter [Solirubrobacteraceae bacterium]|nr:AI-2E family transporter [Solirubrobacteraceae bacterium]